MAKELKELKQFMHGTFSAPSGTDIPDESSTYSLNLDPVTETGKLKGIADDLRQKPLDAGIKRDLRFWSVVPSDSAAGTAGALAEGDKVTITLTAGDETATTGVYTCGAVTSNTSWKAIFELFSSDAVAFSGTSEGNPFNGSCNLGGHTNEQDCLAHPGVWTTSNNVSPLDTSVYENIQSGFANILESVQPMAGYDTSANTGADEEVPLNGILFTAKPEFDELVITFTAVNSSDVALSTFGTSLSSHLGELYTDYLGVAANEMAFLKNQEKDVLIYQDITDPATAQINIVDDFYGTRSIVDTFSTDPSSDYDAPLTISAAEDISMETYYNALYLGPGANNKAQWAGYIDNKQMGEKFEGFDLVDAELFPIDGKEGSASISDGVEIWTAANTPYADYWIGINSTSYKLFSINKAADSGAIVPSNDILPFKPTLIATCKHEVNSKWTNVLVTDKKTNNIYRIEGISVDGSGVITWDAISTIAYSFGNDGSHNKPSNSILIDLLETYEPSVNPSNVLWALFGPTGEDFITHEDSFIFSCQVTDAGASWGESSEYLSVAAASDDSITFRDRTPNTRKVNKRHGINHWDDGRIFNYSLGRRYTSNWGGVHERELFHYKFKKPTDASTFDARDAYTTPEAGFASVADIYDDDKLTTVKREGYIDGYHHNTHNSALNQIQAPKYGGYESFEFYPFKLVDMSQNNFATDISSPTGPDVTDGARAHCCMATGVIDGTKNVSGASFKHRHKMSAHYYIGIPYFKHDYTWTKSSNGGMATLSGLRGFKTSTAHYGHKHVYKYSDNRCSAATGADEFLTSANAGSNGASVNHDVRANTDNSNNKVWMWYLSTNSSGIEAIDEFDNVNALLGLKQVSTKTTDITGGDDGFNRLLLTYVGSELEHAYIALVDKTDGTYVSAGDQPASPNTATTTAGVSNPDVDRALQGPVLLVKKASPGVHDVLISPTAGQYENGYIRMPNSGAWTNISDTEADPFFDDNSGSTADFGVKISPGDETDADAEDPVNFVAGNNYYYKLSFIYDGFQESPLTLYADKYTPAVNLENLLLTVFMKKPVSPRATHVVLYRKKGADEFYKMVKEVKLSASWMAADTDSFKKVILDNGKSGATYESITGMPEGLRGTSVNYALSTQHDSSLVIANCDHAEINNGTHFVFKSQPGNLSVFNWAQDYLVLPNIPTAIKSYSGKLFAWDSGNMHRINMQNMAVEDSYEGVGCFGENAVLVTDLGMFFCDGNNMYMHTGSNLSPIGDAILQSSEGDLAYAWHNITHDTPVQIGYNAKTSSVYFCFNHKPVTGDNVYKAWVYNIRLKRWDLIDIPKPMAVISGPLNELLVSDGEYLWELNSSKVTKKWSYYSKDMTMGATTQVKVLKSIKIEADDITDLAGKVSVEVNDVAASPTLDTTGLKDSSCIIKPDTAHKKFKKIAIKLTDVSTEVDSIGFIYRRKKVK